MPADKPAVSIIVPIYNVEDWLAACCNSLLSQTWTDWEAILLVDGSPDDSISIARRFEDQDARFKVEEIENRGLGGARNAALEIARGDFVLFLDSDDELTPRALEMLMAASLRTGADIAAGYGEDLFDGGIRKRYWTYNAVQFLRRPGTYTLDQMPSLTDDHTAWGKIIRRDLIEREELSFPEGVHCEDIVFSLKSQLAANRVAIVTDSVYLHRRHGAAISADYLREKTLGDWIAEAAKTLDVIEPVDSTVRNHYVLNHTLKQWLTRATKFTRITNPDLLAGVERLAIRMLEVADDDAVTDLDAYSLAVLRAFAMRIPSTRWQSLPTDPLERLGGDGVDDDDFVTAVLGACDALDTGDPVEGHIAAQLALSKLVVPLASGYPLPRAREVLQSVRNLLGGIHPSVLKSVTTPAVQEPGLRLPDSIRIAWQTLATASTAAATITGLRTSATTVTVSGALEHRAHACFKDDFALVFVSESGLVTKAPVATMRDGNSLRWQCAVPPSVLDAGPQRLLLRQSRRYAPSAVDLRLELAEGAVSGGVTVESAPGTVLSFHAPAGLTQHRASHGERLFTFPNWYSNPYMTMLHTEVIGGGSEIPGTVDPGRLMEELRDRRASGAVHIHWTGPLIEKRRSQREAEDFVDEFIEALEQARARGRSVLWSVHNALPHDSKYPETAVRLHSEIARVADIIHVLSQATVDAVDGAYELPAEKVRVLEHSSYQGMYGDRLPMVDARREIGAGSGRTALFFGQLRPYKGLDQLFDAAIALQSDNPVELLLAGKPAPELAKELDRIRSSGVAVTSALRFIEDAEVAAWFSAADVAVLPYRKVLNSGSMMLAATFALPVILPDEPALVADYGGQPWIRFFDTTRSAAAIAELLSDGWFEDADVRRAALEFARRRSPVAMSRGYVRMLREAAA
ncbi:MAG TPA: glycosyltransferase [Candidatus Agrococcus pullicola]|uniref:Glycosyltransferase n=1 Tax=Candidatus Agrococcus pullicola TaxID=2838429 RepID=A0A9D1YRT0_9MICO|nr:glycosyltransferase [Candidatus Agrococcus pullicola]